MCGEKNSEKNSEFKGDFRKKNPTNRIGANKIYIYFFVEAWVAEQLTPHTPDPEVQGPSLTHQVVSLDKELYSNLSLFTQVYKWVPATYCWG